MYKILAPTDFSNNSKGGMRFAMQWASQQKAEIVFVHIYHPISYPIWTDQQFEINTVRQMAALKIRLKKFVENLYMSTKIKPGKHESIVIQGLLSADVDIMDYCRRAADIDFICISTRGAGVVDKLFGTHTGTLITKSPVPVIAVPKHYRKTSLKNVLYASDFKNYSGELKKVIDFARPLRAKINVIHFSRNKEKAASEIKSETELRKKFNYDINFNAKYKHGAGSLTSLLQKEHVNPKPSIIIMFTEQRRNLLKKILSPSKAENLSFSSHIPLLAFHKD
jgi:nucleotide-binding universal stress UspA family protein